MTDMRFNFHTHTSRCGHASGAPRDYCGEALKLGFSAIGFADHAPFPDERQKSSRMSFSQLGAYREDIRNAQSEFPGLPVFAGLEIDYFSDPGPSFYRDVYLGEYEMEYLIGSVHFAVQASGVYWPFQVSDMPPEAVKIFVKRTLEMIENAPIDYVGHPDGFASGINVITPEIKSGFRDIVQAAVAKGLPLEINAKGFQRGTHPGGRECPYPVPEFWEIASEYGAEAIIGADAHAPDQLLTAWADAEKFAEKYSLVPCNRKFAEKISVRTGKSLRLSNEGDVK